MHDIRQKGFAKGRVNFVTLILVLIFISLGYFVVKFSPIYFERFQIQQTLDVLTRRANKLSPQILQKEIMENIQRTGINLLPEDFKVVEKNGVKYVVVYYEREVHHPFGYVTLMQFNLKGSPNGK